MKISLLALLVACLALVGCGGGDDDDGDRPAARATPAPTQAPAGGEEEIRAMFDEYRAALAERDWEGACAHLAPETTDKLQQNITQLGVTNPPTDCPELMDTLYTEIDKNPAAKQVIDDITRTAKVSSVKVDGERASVTWSAKVNGRDTPVTQTARVIDGKWKLIDVN